jgi:hypothetical protein
VGGQRADQLREMSREAVRRLDAAGYDVVGDLKELIPPDDLPEVPRPEDATDAELLDVALDAIAVMLKDQRDMTRERNRWRTRARRAEGPRPFPRGVPLGVLRSGGFDDLRRRLRRRARRGLAAVRRRVRRGL